MPIPEETRERGEYLETEFLCIDFVGAENEERILGTIEFYPEEGSIMLTGTGTAVSVCLLKRRCGITISVLYAAER